MSLQIINSGNGGNLVAINTGGIGNFSTVYTGNRGSILIGDTNSYLYINPPNNDFAFGTGDFTVEWFQYQTDYADFSYSRIFTYGQYYPASQYPVFAVSIEGGDFFLWINGTSTKLGRILAEELVDQWVHFAVTRSGTSIKVFKNGVQYGNTITNSSNFSNSSEVFYIGVDPGYETTSRFYGYLTNFHLAKGYAKYTTTFPVPTEPITPTEYSKLLLLSQTNSTMLTDSSGVSRSVLNLGGATWSLLSPF